MSSSMIRLLFIITFVRLVISRQTGSCPPHPRVVGAGVVPSGRIPEGQSVRITCFAPPNYDTVLFTKMVTCINGRYVPGIKRCRPHVNTPIGG